MESQQEAGGCGDGDKEKMERFFELIRDMREARSLMMRLRGRQVDGALAVVTATQSKRKRADHCCGEGEWGPWVPKFEAEDFGLNEESGAADERRSPRALRMVGVKAKLEEDGSGLNLKLTL